jgi:hypothetical protein
VIAGFAAQQANEIGVRTALGAQMNDVIGLVMGKGLRLKGLGIAIGLPVVSSALDKNVRSAVSVWERFHSQVFYRATRNNSYCGCIACSRSMNNPIIGAERRRLFC